MSASAGAPRRGSGACPRAAAPRASRCPRTDGRGRPVRRSPPAQAQAPPLAVAHRLRIVLMRVSSATARGVLVATADAVLPDRLRPFPPVCPHASRPAIRSTRLGNDPTTSGRRPAPGRPPAARRRPCPPCPRACARGACRALAHERDRATTDSEAALVTPPRVDAREPAGTEGPPRHQSSPAPASPRRGARDAPSSRSRRAPGRAGRRSAHRAAQRIVGTIGDDQLERQPLAPSRAGTATNAVRRWAS